MTEAQIALTDKEQAELLRYKSYFPFRKVSGVKTSDGKFEIFAAATMAQANNYARKTGGVLYVVGA